MKLWIDCYGISVGYLDGSLTGTCENKTQMGMGLKRDSTGTDVDNQY